VQFFRSAPRLLSYRPTPILELLTTARCKKNVELSEIIMEINDLQKTSLDNQPLAQTVLEINDFRGGTGFDWPQKNTKDHKRSRE
jgi:hypothetical protein